MSRRERARAVLLAGLLVVSSFAMVGVGAAAPSGDATTFHVKQGGECYEVTPISGDGNVSEFYDYQTPNESYTYSSHGTQDLQQNQASNLFLYHGTEGVSLVMVHDKLGDGPHGSAITFDISGLPSDRMWAVEDDSYGENTDDNFTHYDTSSSIDWMWQPDRTDGAAVRGLGGDDYEEITIDPGFNEAADDWGKWKWTGGDNRTEEWRLLGADKSEVASLDLSEGVTIAKGECPDTTDPDAKLSASPNPAANDEAVTFDASNSSGTGSDIAEYRWDFDNDDEIDRTTFEPNVSRLYDTPGTYTAAVTVVDGGGNTDMATTEIEITESSSGGETGLDAAFSATPNPAGNDEAVSFDASDSSGDIEHYQWDFGDGTTDTGETASHTYDQPGDYEVTLTVNGAAGNSDTATEIVTVEESTGGETDGIEFVNATTVEVTGTFETVKLDSAFYASDGAAQSDHYYENVSGTTLITVPQEGVNGSVVASASADRNFSDGEVEFYEENPTFESDYERVQPAPVTVSFEGATQTEDDTYEATFAYANPNDETLYMDSEFIEGNVSGDAPAEFAPGEHTFTATWTPDSDDERATWQLDRSAFDQSAVSASTPPASQLGDGGDAEPTAAFSVSSQTVGNDEAVSFDASDSSGDVEHYQWDFGDGATATGETVTHAYDEPGEYEVALTVNDAAGNTDTATKLITVEDDSKNDDPKDDDPKNDQPKDDDPKQDDGPTAKLTLSPDKADFGDKVSFDASASTSDADIVEYRWNFDGDDDIDRRTNTKENSTVFHDGHKIYDEPGTYTASVAVVDANGDKDIAGAQITIERNDHTKPGATLHVPESAEVGEKVHLKATDLTGVESGVSHICWVVVDGDEHHHDKPDGKTATHVFDSPGDKTVKLHIVDKAGNKNMIERTITAVEADTGGSDEDDDNSDKKPVVDDPNDGSDTGGIGAANPSGGSNANDDSNEQNDRVAASLGADDDVSEVVVESSGATLTVNESAPAAVRAPTAEADGFEALSYVTVAGADGANATFTVANDRLEAADAAPEHVSLFRFEDGEWTAVDVQRLNATDDAQRFAANATNGTYAVGVERPATAIAGVSVSDDRVAPGDRATVTATVTNDGLAAGTHEVELTVDGEVVATESVTVPADSTREVEFARSFDEPGVYQVSVGGERAEVVVEGIETTEATTTEAGPATTEPTETTTESSTDGGVPGFGVGAALVALLGAALLARRRS